MTTIVAYVFNADIHTPIGVLYALEEQGRLTAHERGTLTPEEALDILAAREGVNRSDENTFDSDAFPKVVFDYEIDEINEWGHPDVASECGSCGEMSKGNNCAGCDEEMDVTRDWLR